MIPVDRLSEPLLLLVAALAGVIETVFPPFPSEGLLLLVAFTAARKGMSPVLLVAVATLGSFVSLYGLYLLGRGPLRDRVGRRVRRWSRSLSDGMDRFFRAHGIVTVLLSRFLPAVRGPVTFLAGVYGLKRLPTAIALFAGCAAWNLIVILIGGRAGAAWDGTSGGLVRVGFLTAGAVALLWGLGLLIRSLLARGPRASRTPPRV